MMSVCLSIYHQPVINHQLSCLKSVHHQLLLSQIKDDITSCVLISIIRNGRDAFRQFDQTVVHGDNKQC